LKRDGFMLHDLGASILPRQPKNVEGVVWTFNKIGKEDNKDLPFHKFEYVPPTLERSQLTGSAGAYIFLSRTDPCADPVLEDGTIQKFPEVQTGDKAKDVDLQPNQWMRVKVYSRGNKFVRIIIPTPIENLAIGRWR
jgi:hypothetical protein